MHPCSGINNGFRPGGDSARAAVFARRGGAAVNTACCIRWGDALMDWPLMLLAWRSGTLLLLPVMIIMTIISKVQILKENKKYLRVWQRIWWEAAGCVGRVWGRGVIHTHTHTHTQTHTHTHTHTQSFDSFAVFNSSSVKNNPDKLYHWKWKLGYRNSFTIGPHESSSFICSPACSSNCLL